MESKAETVELKLRSEYFTKYPKLSARTMDTIPSEFTLQYLKELPISSARAVFFQLNPDTVTELIGEMDDEFFRALFSQVNTHLGARLLSRLDKDEVARKLALLPDLIAREIKGFLKYEIGSAGYLMETNTVVFTAENTVKEALNKIRKLGNRRIVAIYIVSDEGELLGKVPVQYIAVSDPAEVLGVLMEPAPAVNALASREDVLKLMERADILQIPVTDINNHFLGVIHNPTLMTATKREFTEDLQAMFGAGREEQALSKVSFAVRKRLPWLQVNLATAFLASMVVGFFEDTIAQITILAIFLPVVAGQSGNTGSQALAVTMRGLALKEIRISQWFKVARKEIMVGFVNGIAVAITTGVIVYFWASSFGIAVVIGISMVISMIIAGFAGAVIPMMLKAIGQDPATSSSIVLTTVTDICGFLSFLGLATALSSSLGIV